ncbi:MAG: cohesin domain-containing protein [Saprospiraceae bacterium]
MFQRLLPLAVGLWLTMASDLPAQVGFSLPVVNQAMPGGIVAMPVTVSNFDSIVVVQFVIQWDPQVISFLNVTSLNLPGLKLDDFNTMDAPNGMLRFVYEAPNVQSGVTLTDNTIIFRVRFLVVGQQNQGTPVIFTESPPTDFEVVKAGTPPIGYDMEDCDLNNGYVAVGFTLSTDWLDDPNTLPVSVSPNPFPVSTTAFLDLDSASDVNMILTDASGHPVLSRKMWLGIGRHGMEIAPDTPLDSGIYYLILRTAAGRSCVRPVVKL